MELIFGRNAHITIQSLWVSFQLETQNGHRLGLCRKMLFLECYHYCVKKKSKMATTADIDIMDQILNIKYFLC